MVQDPLEGIFDIVVEAVAMRVTSALIISEWFFPYWEMTQSTGTIPKEKKTRASPHNRDIIPLVRR